MHVAHLVDQHVSQPDLAEQLGDTRAATRFGSRRRGQARELDLPCQRDLIGPLEVSTGGLDAGMREQGVDRQGAPRYRGSGVPVQDSFSSYH